MTIAPTPAATSSSSSVPAASGRAPSGAMSEPFDPDAIDAEGFLAELKALREELDASLGEEDLVHLRKMERWGRMATAAGLLTAGIAPNPVSAMLLGLGRSTRWLMMHHVAHRGYDKVPGVPAKYTSKVFARGNRRMLDWPDWMHPEAWIYEHNVLHHFHTGETRDPDLIERNADMLRNSSMPMPVRYAYLTLLALTWRASYYAPNTMRVWMGRHIEGLDPEDRNAFPPGHMKQLWLQCYLPYGALNFVALPALFTPFGPWAVFSAFCNSVMAEAVTNVHTFCVVGPNHTGDDLYRFEDRPSTRAEFFVRQVVGSVNFALGTDRVDYAHLWLNYQIEHHLWPDVPMLKYQQFQPRVKALCEKYGIPYVQEGVMARVKKMADVIVGKASMRRAVRSVVSRAVSKIVPEAAPVPVA